MAPPLAVSPSQPALPLVPPACRGPDRGTRPSRATAHTVSVTNPIGDLAGGCDTALAAPAGIECVVRVPASEYRPAAVHCVGRSAGLHHLTM